MIKKNIIQDITNKEMDRKEFLKYSGIMLLGLIGLRGIIALLSPSGEHSSARLIEKSETESRGFGGGRYGV